MKKWILLFTLFLFLTSDFHCFAAAEDLNVSEPEILFPVEKFQMSPALSKFYWEENIFMGAHSDLSKIVFQFHDGRKKFLSTAMMELEDFVIRGEFIYLLGYTEKGPEILISDFHGKLMKRVELAATPPSMTSLAVDSRGIIHHNNPSLREGLITSYNAHGEIERVFSDHLPSKYFAEMKLLNRVLMCVDQNDHLIIAFRFDPIVRKYDQAGKLIFERRILPKEVRQRMKAEKLRFPERFTLTKERRVKISAFTYFTSLAVDQENRIYLKFGPESLIFQLSDSGRLERKLILAFEHCPIEDFDFWESSMVIEEPFLFFPHALEGSESFGYILKYKLQ